MRIRRRILAVRRRGLPSCFPEASCDELRDLCLEIASLEPRLVGFLEQRVPSRAAGELLRARWRRVREANAVQLSFVEALAEFFARARVHARARELVVAESGGLFDHQYARFFDRLIAGLFAFFVVGGDRLHQMVGRRQCCGARADVQDIDFHALAFDLAHFSFSPGV